MDSFKAGTSVEIKITLEIFFKRQNCFKTLLLIEYSKIFFYFIIKLHYKSLKITNLPTTNIN